MEEPLFSQGECFISDLGGNRLFTAGGSPLFMGRYAVWRADPDAQQFQMLEVGWNLNELLQKYGVSPQNVGKVGN